MSTQHPFEDAPESATPVPDEETFTVEDGSVLYEDQVTPEYGILGFTLRELILVGVWLVAFVVSFFPLAAGTTSVWGQGISWVLPIGLPTAAMFLIVLRRFSPDGIRRVGSLGIDQFASVTFTVAAIWWAQVLWSLVGSSIASGIATAAWVPWVELVASLGLVALTVFAPLIPGVREDFIGRLETLAHRNANPVRPVIARPREPKNDDAAATPEAEHTGTYTDEIATLGLADQVPLSAHASGGDTGSVLTEDEYVPGYARRSRREEAEVDEADGTDANADIEPIVELGLVPDASSDADVAEETPLTESFDVDATNPRFAPTSQPFWALAPTERDVVDERGELLFRIGPDAWALVIEDRGGAFVVRHDDGRIGYLHDIDDITKG
ncbi:hypothetical protein OED01_09845 [Microbacterium sp. M28]|uniref:hypothetical protein n=1 Tax=Microbacterium sp. M28 TaxID=2962064 RepID=UPI0021F4694C|nr:hypothetical protein [Microbacterium sp. M28]UYO95912.1 hypothetical protein OED01_09845 [Microbacterium sp. M28]